jgi:hypothetical protein
VADWIGVDVEETTQTTEAGDSPPRYAYCHWHKGLSSSAVLVQIIEQQSGPGASLYACGPCRVQYRLTPVSEQP